MIADLPQNREIGASWLVSFVFQCLLSGRFTKYLPALSSFSYGMPVTSDQLSQLVYEAPSFGTETFLEWQARDESAQLFSSSRKVNIKVLEVNDPPLMSSIDDKTFDIAKTNPWVRYFDPTTIEQGQTWTIEVEHDNPNLIASVDRHVTANDRIFRRGRFRFDFVDGTIGTANVTVTVRDSGGTARGGQDTTVTSFRVTVRDIVNPAILDVPLDASVIAGPGLRIMPVSWTPLTLNANSGLTNLSSNHTSGDLFPIGDTTVTYLASDALGNEETASFIVTVLDQESPMVVNPVSSFSVSLPIGGVTSQAYWVPPLFVDNDRIKLEGSTHVPGDAFPAGDTAVHYWAEDPSGNRSISEFVVSVVDRELPVLSGVPSDMSQTGCGSSDGDR